VLYGSESAEWMLREKEETARFGSPAWTNTHKTGFKKDTTEKNVRGPVFGGHTHRK